MEPLLPSTLTPSPLRQDVLQVTALASFSTHLYRMAWTITAAFEVRAPPRMGQLLPSVVRSLQPIRGITPWPRVTHWSPTRLEKFHSAVFLTRRTTRTFTGQTAQKTTIQSPRTRSRAALLQVTANIRRVQVKFRQSERHF